MACHQLAAPGKTICAEGLRLGLDTLVVEAAVVEGVIVDHGWRAAVRDCVGLVT